MLHKKTSTIGKVLFCLKNKLLLYCISRCTIIFVWESTFYLPAVKATSEYSVVSVGVWVCTHSLSLTHMQSCKYMYTYKHTYNCKTRVFIQNPYVLIDLCFSYTQTHTHIQKEHLWLWGSIRPVLQVCLQENSPSVKPFIYSISSLLPNMWRLCTVLRTALCNVLMDQKKYSSIFCDVLWMMFPWKYVDSKKKIVENQNWCPKVTDIILPIKWKCEGRVEQVCSVVWPRTYKY